MTDKTDGQEVEKGFNDDELADIMSEIESLEKDFDEESFDDSPAEDSTEESDEEMVEEVEEEYSEEDFADEEEPVMAQSPQDVADEVMASPDPVEKVYAEKTPEVKQVVSELAHTPEPCPVVKEAPVVESKVHHMPVKPTPSPEWKPSGAQTSMSFKVEGDMKLSMSFFVAGKEFNVWVDEKDGFVIELDGGAQFKVPMHHAGKKAA